MYQTIDQIRLVLKNYSEIEKVIVYGSRAIGIYRSGSDIDLTFVGENLNSKIMSNISNGIDDLLTPYMFDLSILSQIDNTDLVEHIRKFGVVFYEKAF